MNKYLLYFISFFSLYTIIACQSNSEPVTGKSAVLNYNNIADQVKRGENGNLSDSSNLFDMSFYDPSKDSLGGYYDSLFHIYMKDSELVRLTGINDSGILTNPPSDQHLTNTQNKFSDSLKAMHADELRALKYNLSQLHSADSLRMGLTDNNCKQAQCRVWAKIIKSEQRLYLYIDGQFVDTFKVSTGIKKHETPVMDRRPSGPTFQKYTSKKFPGGNYNGLGNMPYAVFIRGGYAIHGTTQGNIKKLGKKASHGCIRLHPDNGKIFFELVRKAGLENTWITIEE
jgi:hypothetical protein